LRHPRFLPVSKGCFPGIFHPDETPPKGRTNVATGEAERNPWKEEKQNPAPEGADEWDTRDFKDPQMQTRFVRKSPVPSGFFGHLNFA